VPAKAARARGAVNCERACCFTFFFGEKQIPEALDYLPQVLFSLKKLKISVTSNLVAHV
jgi:hypothetical protein